MDHWLELRTAYRLAKLGTVSAAAADLGVHRATVNRHVDVLETAFGTKFFQRHGRGYTLTDAGRDLLDVANRAEDMFADLAGRSRGKAGQLSGALVITSLSGLAPLIIPAIQTFITAHPEIHISFVADENLARLEYGEAHIAIRAGARPQDADYVVLPFQNLHFGLFAAQSYIARHGMPDGHNLATHHLVGALNPASRLPYAKWAAGQFQPEQIILETSDRNVINAAVFAGLGLGFLAHHDIRHRPDMVEIIGLSGDWTVSLWIVTHMDIHRTQKVQEFLTCLTRHLGDAKT